MTNLPKYHAAVRTRNMEQIQPAFIVSVKTSTTFIAPATSRTAKNMPTHPASIDAGWVFPNLCPRVVRECKKLLKTENPSLSTDSLIHLPGNAGGFLQTKFEGNPIMGNTIEIAASSNLVGSYHAMFDGILNSTAGQLITKGGRRCCSDLSLGGLSWGESSKAMGRSNQLISMFCPSVTRVIVVLRRHLHLRWPTITIPALLTALDWIVNAVGSQGKDYFGI